MISVDEARWIVLEQTSPLPPRVVDLNLALGCVLAEPIVSDLDLPPFDKALMDGFALRSEDFQGDGPYRFAIGEVIVAGAVPTRPLRSGEAAVIMTGAPLPPGADCVVPHERTHRSGEEQIILTDRLRPGSSTLLRAREMRRGETLFEPGTVLDAVKLGVLASVGQARVAVVRRPKVHILPTGDELVPVDRIPGPGQIRETNSTILDALAQFHGHSRAFPVAPDTPQGLRNSLLFALEEGPDVLLVCGGVSAGQKDLVPGSLRDLGFESMFHQIRLKPGKPLLFARPSPDCSGSGPLVFGLPGNPVSGIVGFLLLVRPVLRKMAGHDVPLQEPSIEVELGSDFSHRGDRPTYHPAKLDLPSNHKPRARPLEWAGSADLRTVSLSDGFIAFPAGDRTYREGDTLPFLALPRHSG